ncbi:hypothetical protein [Pacificibacter sp. AS14]|uniref:hypothetical protein n=1 Tax=Pacificibacter sp. AS14 TaxID=3135785 RepID=UPI0031821DF5
MMVTTKAQSSMWHCNHNSVFTKTATIEMFGADKPLEAIRNGARCRECGHLGAETIAQYPEQTGLVTKAD